MFFHIPLAGARALDSFFPTASPNRIECRGVDAEC
jgi:hypothetical protein